MAIRTKAQSLGCDIVIDVGLETIKLWRFGEREKREISIEAVFESAIANAPPPITSRTKNSIVAVFIRHRGNASIWRRLDTGDELTERELRAAGRRERRPVIPLYGMPLAKHGMGGA